MADQLPVLLFTALNLGFVHTLAGPDHYLPFVAISKAKKWSMFKTAWVTFLCAIGHILSSVILGYAGIFMGINVTKLVNIESYRGDLAAWFLIAFGLVYFVWGLRKAWKNKPHRHFHFHPENEQLHTHNHTHHYEHLHVHESKRKSVTPWVMFIIFVFGPCEPLIPILMYPAAKGNMAAGAVVAVVFGSVTIVTMICAVLALSFGLLNIPAGKIKFLRLDLLEKYSHAVAGLTIFVCGGLIKFAGL